MSAVIETDRLVLRTWQPSDEAAAAQMYGDAETVRYLGKGYQSGFDPQSAARIAAALRDRADREPAAIWAVAAKDGDAFVGECGLHPAPLSGDVELVYLIVPAARRRGYAVEAASAVLEHAFARLGLRRVAAFVHPENRASIAVVRRVGLRFDRVVRAFSADVLRYFAFAPP